MSNPKAVANRIKEKGLKKLRWYCQMCEKQCRDENGFKNHTMSEAHQRQLLLVAENPNRFVSQFSEEFRANFLHHLRRRYNTRRVSANIVYNEYIQDKTHLHMNATQWVTLTGFVKYLGREGYCVVDETPKGWFIQYIDRDPETLARQKQVEREEMRKKSEEDRQQELLELQMQRDRALAEARGEDMTEHESTELKRASEEEKIVISFAPKAKELPVAETAHKDAAPPEASASASSTTASSTSTSTTTTSTPSSSSSSAAALFKAPSLSSVPKQPEDMKRKMSALELIMQEEEAKKKAKLEREQEKTREQEAAAAADRKDYWLYEGIVVKVMNKELKDGKYYKRKGTVVEVVDKYTARIRLHDSTTVLKLDQEFLETVIPALEHEVLVVNGKYRGYKARLDTLDIDKYTSRVTMLEGPYKGQQISAPYEDICKLDDPASS